MIDKWNQFMSGRYGLDDLGRFSYWAVLALLVLGMFLSPLFTALALALLAFGLYRLFSRDRERRLAENQAYLRGKAQVLKWFGVRKERFDQRGTYRYFTCPNCRQDLRVPRGKGEITITCPKCHTQFQKKS